MFPFRGISLHPDLFPLNISTSTHIPMSFAASEHPTEMFTKDEPKDYRGSISKTASGLDCLPWPVAFRAGPSLEYGKDKGLTIHSFNTSKIDGIGLHNFCRMPTTAGMSTKTDVHKTPWCYTGGYQDGEYAPREEECTLDPSKAWTKVRKEADNGDVDAYKGEQPAPAL
jgi:hypothetical protein